MSQRAEALYATPTPVKTESAATYTLVTIDGTNLQGINEDYTIGLEAKVASWRPVTGGNYSGFCRAIGSVHRFGTGTLYVLNNGAPDPCEGAHAGVSDIVFAVSGTDILVQIVVPDGNTIYHQAWVQAYILSLVDEE